MAEGLSSEQMLAEIHAAATQTRDDIAAIRKFVENDIVEKLASSPLGMFLK